MRTFQKIVASSVVFNALTPAISTSAAATTAQFGPGAKGGPTPITFVGGYTLQANFGGNGLPSSGSYGGVFNLLVSNVNEKPMFVVAASALIASTGSVMFNAAYGNYSWIDFQFLPAITSTSGFVTIVLQCKSGV